VFHLKKIYVGNLPYSTTSEELEELFAEFGDVESAVVISDKFSGRSKGFGFVEFTDDEAVKAAMEKMDGSDVGGRNIKVSEARERK
jgi:RNA recognition motif-containing protein